MSKTQDMPQQENISEVRERILRYGENEEDPIDLQNDAPVYMSDDEIREKLHMEFGSEFEFSAPKSNDAYHLDEDFLAEASVEEFPEKMPEEIPEDEEMLVSEEIIDDFEEPEDISEDELHDDVEIEELSVFDELLADIATAEALRKEDDTVSEPYDDIDDDITFGDLVYSDEDDGIVLTKLDLEEDIIPTEELIPESIEDEEEDIAYMHLEDEVLEDELIEELSAGVEEYAEPVPEPKWEGPKIPVSLFAEQKADIPSVPEIVEEPEEEITEIEQVEEETSQEVVDLESPEISLLMQLGCDEEVLDRCSKETVQKMADAEALSEDPAPEKTSKTDSSAKQKILARHESYKRTCGALLVKLALGVIIALALLVYEGLPEIFGVEILNREEYFISYALLGLQAAVLCGVVAYARIWEGIKKLFTRSPNVYSMVGIIAIVTLIYDVAIMFAESAVPKTYHFLFAFSVLIALASEYVSVISERRCFEFYFSNILFEDKNSVEKRFILRRSSGISSSAEKMYEGGLDSNKNVFFPADAENALGFFNASKAKPTNDGISMVLMVPVIAFSLICGILSMVLLDEIWTGLAAVIVSLFMCLPFVWATAKLLPFERVSAGSSADRYAFAGEGSADYYADCDVTIFSDMHLFSRCSASAVNLMLYDATAKDVLLGCLNAVYSNIGGPMEQTFKAAQSSRFEDCNIIRIAKSGVEATVGTSYSVLLGTEAFMQRYGINFPKVTLKDQDDEIFTLCVSINGRVSARIAVRYTVNEVFEMLISRLAEDGIQCAVETFDPMINAQTLTRIRAGAEVPVSIVHLGVKDFMARQDAEGDRMLYNASGEQSGVIAEGSRFNLAVALCTAKHLRRLRKYTDLASIGLSALGAVITLLVVALGVIDGFSQFFVMLYWLLEVTGFAVLIFKFLPAKDRFSLERYKQEQKEKQIKKVNNEK